MPIAEYKQDEPEVLTSSPELQRRIVQQKLLAELGVTALQGDLSFDQLLHEAARLTAEGSRQSFARSSNTFPKRNVSWSALA